MKQKQLVLKAEQKQFISWAIVLTLGFVLTLLWVDYQKLQEKYNELKLEQMQTAEIPTKPATELTSNEAQTANEFLEATIIDYKSEIEHLKKQNELLKKTLNEYVGRWIIAQIIEIEGTESNHPADPGGYTRFGISSKVHGFVPKTYDEAVQFYLDNFWYAMRLNELNSVKLQFALMDAAVLFGRPYINKILSKLVGTKTFNEAIDKIRLWKDDEERTENLIKNLKRSLNSRIKELTEANESLKIFASGWQKRVERY